MVQTPPAARRSPAARSAAVRAWLVLAAVAGLSGCRGEPLQLDLGDLNPDETTYVTRIVTLERAKALALADPDAGSAILDSLAIAWGDSSLSATIDLVAPDPYRFSAVSRLLVAILLAEQDSLLASADSRLHEPLPAPRREDPSQPPPP